MCDKVSTRCESLAGRCLQREVTAPFSAPAVSAACHVERKAEQLPHLTSLIVCPPTLVGHWPHEVLKFVGSNQISIFQARTPLGSNSLPAISKLTVSRKWTAGSYMQIIA